MMMSTQTQNGIHLKVSTKTKQGICMTKLV